MNVIIETRTGETLITMEVGYFDTILEIKENIEKYRGIPASRQTLLFNGEKLRDEDNIFDYGMILHNSRIVLMYSPELENDVAITDYWGRPVNTTIIDTAEPEIIEIDDSSNEQLHDSTTIESNDQESDFKNVSLSLKLQLAGRQNWILITTDAVERVKQLKEKIHRIEGEAAFKSVPANWLMLHAEGGIELEDERHLYEYDVLMKDISNESDGDCSKIINVSFLLELFVLSRCETKKIKVQVNSSHKVQVLRKEVEEATRRSEFVLPGPDERYFFIHNQSVMEEDKSFLWHHCQQGDIIDVFPGWISTHTNEGPGKRRRSNFMRQIPVPAAQLRRTD